MTGENVLDDPFDPGEPALTTTTQESPGLVLAAISAEELIRFAGTPADLCTAPVGPDAVEMMHAATKRGRKPAPVDEMKDLQEAVKNVVKFVKDLEKQQGIKLTRLRECLGKYGE